ncbi:hypothetical protein HPB48_000596 [Haemaphysalis longicornis]|uniref:Uncharacterized protein n=1 Tax=Haemaphysalis longicornis TaxID=44386 RepID=A0A9J6FU71_HAELO|nr:hypothetical protein HPB48_000596 [Haemaphysalis longicornis]
MDLSTDETVWAASFASIPYQLMKFGLDQMITQRFLAARSLRDARGVAFLGVGLMTFFYSIYGLTGLAIIYWFRDCDPVLSGSIARRFAVVASAYLPTIGARAEAMSTGSGNSSEAMVKFVKERVESNQGISLQELTGHLSQLLFGLRAAFENCEHTSLPLSGLEVGESAIFDAKVRPKDCEARHDRNGQANYGFIKFGHNKRKRAFFHANDIVDKSFGKAIKSLPDLLTVEDKVRFSTKPSTKTSDKVKWQATAVALCRSSDGTAEHGKEVIWSDAESDIQDFLLEKLHESKNPEAGFNESPMGGGDWDARPVQTTYSRSSSVKGEKNARLLLSEWESKQKLSGERAFLSPVAESLGTIKFGPDLGLTACATVEVTYRDEERIDNLLWEVADVRKYASMLCKRRPTLV